MNPSATFERLLKAGYTAPSANSLIDSHRLSQGGKERELKALVWGAEMMGPKNAMEFLRESQASSASRQLSKRRLLKPSADGHEELFLLESFAPLLGKILKDKALSRNGFGSIFQRAADAPFFICIEIFKKPNEGSMVGRLGFDIFFNRANKPCAMLGNFQGGGQELVKEFREKTGSSALDFMLAAFKRSFPGQRLFALNVRRHRYRKKIDENVLASAMHNRGKLSDEQIDAFRNALFGFSPLMPKHLKAKKIEEIRALRRAMPEDQRAKAIEAMRVVRKERQHIRRDATGMHKAAFKKAGFKASRSRTWRML